MDEDFDPGEYWEPTDADWYVAGFANAMAEDLSMRDVWEAIQHHKDGRGFDEAINLLIQTMPDKCTCCPASAFVIK